MQYAGLSFPRRSHHELTGFTELVTPALLALYLALVVISLTAVERAAGVDISPSPAAALGTALSLCLLPLFARAGFSFGYTVGIPFFGMIAGFVWLSYFSGSRYDHAVARWSALASLLAFLVPLLFQVAPARPLVRLTNANMKAAIKALLVVAALILLLNASYGFTVVGISEAAQLRAGIVRPALLSYATNNIVYAVLPFAFAFSAQRGSRLMAALSLLLLLCFYPTLLNKTVLFAALWLPFVFVVFRSFDPKRAAVISLGIPLVLGLVVPAVLPANHPIAHFVFGYVNERMFAIPSIALDLYADFFAINPATHFCQVNIVRTILGCPYSQQLGVVFANQYGVGNLNASLFATEGVASIGLYWSPIVMLLCGAVLSIGNSCSRHLSPVMIATSSALVLQALLNIPLSTTLLTNGLLLLFLLWYVCPDEQRERASMALPADFRPDVVTMGIPVRFRGTHTIEAVIGKRVVLFESWEDFFAFLAR